MWVVDILNSIVAFWVKPIIIFSFLSLYVCARVDKSSSACHWILSMFGSLGICILIAGWFLPITLNLAIIPHGLEHWLNVHIDAQGFGKFFLICISGLYIFIALFLMNLRFYDLYVTWRLVSGGQKLHDININNILCINKTKLRIKKHISVYVSDCSTTPMVWGVFSPRIVLPSSYVVWGKDRAERILVHELAHIKRNDWIVKQMVFVFTCLFWFIPNVRSWQKKINWYAELACDDVVICTYNCRAEYATDLMTLGTSMRLNQAFLGFVEEQTLAARIRYVLDSGREREPLADFFKFAMCFVFIVLITFFSAIRFSSMSWLYSDEFMMSYSAIIKKDEDNKKVSNHEDVMPSGVFEENVGVENNTFTAIYDAFFVSPTVLPPLNKRGNNQEEIRHVISPKKLVAINGEYIDFNKLTLIKTPEISMSGYVGQHVVAPVYPHRALMQDIEGKVTALFDIDESGRVQNIRIINAYPSRIFNKSVISALQKSIYEPAKNYNYAITTKNVKEIFIFNIHHATHITQD